MPKRKSEKAMFAAGCFWHVQLTFDQAVGVLATAVGYSGGHTKNPTYHDVCSDETGHAEVIEIEFDPSVTSYEELLEIFWKMHDPTTMNRQGPDVGSQYRSAIFYYTEEQRKKAIASKERIQTKYARPVVTEITKSSPFYPAENYHQKYLEKKGLKTCGF